METENDRAALVPLKVWAALVAELVLFAVVFFATAGTLRWGAAWAVIGLFAATAIPMTISLGRADPALLEERMKLRGQADQPAWDKALVKVLVVLFGLWLFVPGLDAARFGWSHMPLWLQIAGGALMVGSLWAAYRVMLQNTYLAPTVRVQQERGHTVISSGAYGVVRHPFYAALIPFFPAVGLTLGSWWCVVASLPIILLLAYRATREERHLERDLPGYADYMAKVRYRLVPGVW